jgi:hypothetical protein
MLYLVKMQRCYGNHQYIEGVYHDEEIAYFMGEYHQKFIRGGHKYYYIVEPLNFVHDHCHIVSWENDDETLRYRVYHNEEHAEEHIKETDNKNYRYQSKTYHPIHNTYPDDIDYVAEYWHFFEGKELLGLRKLYKMFLKDEYEKKSKK